MVSSRVSGSTASPLSLVTVTLKGLEGTAAGGSADFLLGFLAALGGGGGPQEKLCLLLLSGTKSRSWSLSSGGFAAFLLGFLATLAKLGRGWRSLLFSGTKSKSWSLSSERIISSEDSRDVLFQP